VSEPENRTFEELYRELEETAKQLERGNLPLEEALRLYERGTELVDRLREILRSAELRVQQLHARLASDETELREVESEYQAGGR